MKGNLLVLQSGGPTAVINTTLLGIIEAYKKYDFIDKIYGSLYGITGLIGDNLIDLGKESEKELSYLRQTPGAILGSCRYHLSDVFDSDYKNILKTIQKHNISYIAFIGGNDSMDSALKLNNYLQSLNYPCYCIGVPKTVDNDLVGIDSCPGYGSAIKYIANTIQDIYLDTASYTIGRVTIVELMGRDAGWLTAGSKLACLNNAGPDLIYLPETPFDSKKFLADVKRIYKEKQRVLVCVSEGVKNKKGDYLSALMVSDSDTFGHIQLGGISTYLTSLIKEKLSLPVRGIELNLPQRCFTDTISLYDSNLAYNLGYKCIELGFKNNVSGKMITYSNKKYSFINLNEVANCVRFVPKEYILGDNDISNEFINYAKELIVGEVKKEYKNGLPCYTHLKNIKVK